MKNRNKPEEWNNGTMEYWNDGMVEESKDRGPEPKNNFDFGLRGLLLVPIFHYSKIPGGFL
jgi:hypothetical protein